MTYDDKAAEVAAYEWDIDEATVRSWQKKNHIPDLYALHRKPEHPDRYHWYLRILALAADGWLKSSRVCKHYGWASSRISNILRCIRYPGEYQHCRLFGEEVDAIRVDFLERIRNEVLALCSDIDAIKTDAPVSREILNRLMVILRHPFINGGRVRQGLTPANSRKIYHIIQRQRALPDRLSDKPMLYDVFEHIRHLKELLTITYPNPLPDNDENDTSLMR